MYHNHGLEELIMLKWQYHPRQSTDSMLLVVVQLLSCVWLFVTPWTAAHQASLSFTIYGVFSNSCPLSGWCNSTISSSVGLVSSCLQSFPMSLFFFSNESAFYIWWPKYWSFGLISLQSKGFSRVFSSTAIQKHQFFSTLPSLWFNCHICTWLLGKA